MRLKSIKLAGFKSFVDPTTVPFSTNMTAIVGPNGCGKSNIIDAVRWVMGESSAKNLRGESMTDVIFNGSSGRQPVGQASIELVFDNQEGKLTGEYASFSEISIKRKVTREGTSQYYLNGTKCRRRDVTDIFLGTGMGPRSYAIIEQGMISRLIESKPEELRVYLEEAAGISKYKERRRETENRMRRTQDNLDRLSDIREELGKQLQHLKRQANAAERYAEYKKEERLLSAKLHFVYWSLLDHDLSGKSGLAEKYEKEIEDAVIAKNTNENRVDVLRTQLEEKQEVFNRFQAKYYQSGGEITALEQKIKFQRSRVLEQEQQVTRLNEEIAEIEEVLLTDNETLELVLADLEEIEALYLELQERSEQSAIELEDLEAEMISWQQKWDQFNLDSADKQKRAELEQAKIQQTEERIKEFEIRHDRLSRSSIDIQQNIDELGHAQWDEDLLILDEKLLTAQQDVDDLLPALDSQQEKIESLSDQKTSLQARISEKKAVLASLKTLQDSVLGKDDGVDKQNDSLGLSNLPLLMNRVDVAEGWEKAAQQALSEWMNTLVTDDSVISLFDREDFSTLEHPLSLANNNCSNCPAKEGTLSKLIGGASFLNTYLNEIRVASNNEEARNIVDSLVGNESVITPDGIWLSPSWVRVYRPSDSEGGILERSKSIALLEEEIPLLSEELEAKSLQLITERDELHRLRDELDKHEALIKSLTVDKTRLVGQQGADKAKFDQFNLQLKRNEEEIKELLTQVDQYRDTLAESREVWDEAMMSLEENADRKNELSEQKANAQIRLDEARNLSREMQNSVHQKQMVQQQKISQSASLKQTIDRLDKELAYKKQRISELGNSEHFESESIEELSLQLEGLLETRVVAEERLNEARQAVESVTGSLRDEEGARVKFDNAIQNAREKLETIRMDTQALAINKKNLQERILEDGFEIQELGDQIEETDNEEYLKATLEQLGSRIQRLGSINLAAIDEYKVQNERKEHLDEQNDELVAALDTLVDAIKKIDKETRTRFKETYDQVNEGLQRLFPKIFGGGNAYLELTDDNLLETGVMIIARPPGKKNATIHLLSGGEKSLTAIALIFAIFELNPAPFCMLDEVDAPLDDANVGRFARMVKEMSSQVQFIYISHNKVSMEKADQLMGVTMHEPGCSRLVSVDIDEAAAMVEM
jgi:chromosome segregation protein